jgi:16S rRNA (guanine527-N7)-methyltransferase
VKQRVGRARMWVRKMRDEKLQRYADLVVRYHDTLDLVSERGLGGLGTLIAEAEQYAELIIEVAGPSPVIVDVGSGGGLPGVVLAVRLPQAEVHLVERRRRRGAFLSMVVGQLGLSNAQVWTSDVQDLQGVVPDVVTAQAVAGFAAIARLTRHLHPDPCFLVSRRGADWEGEVPQVAAVLAADEAETRGRLGPSSGSSAARDEASAVVAVAAERPLGRDGSLVALRLRGGRACRPSA